MKRPLLSKLMMIAALVVVVSLLSGCGRTVPPGHRGIYFNWRAGTDVNNILLEGFHFLLPWNRIYLYDVRVKDRLESLKILTKDQLNISTEVSIRYRPVAEKVGTIQVEVGEEYYKQLIGPTLRNVARVVISSYAGIEAYAKRQEIQTEIEEKVRVKLEGKNIHIEAVLLRNMEFPEQVAKAIDEKMAMQQESEKMFYVLEKEAKEAERKSIEAKGIADFQRIVSDGINANLLKWKGIEATLKLAESGNAKIVVIGAGKDGMPLILGND